VPFPLSFLPTILGFVPLIIFARLVVVLREAGHSDFELLALRKSPWIWRLLALIFAGFVIGLGGTVPFLDDRLALPIAFLLGFLGIRLILRRRIEEGIAEIEGMNDVSNGSEALAKARAEILQRAVELQALKRVDAELFSKYAKGEIDRPKYCDDRADLGVKRRKLIESSSAERVDELRLPKGWSPEKIALSLGPTSSWWESGIASVRVAAKLAILPVSYFTYILVTNLFYVFRWQYGWPYLDAAASLFGEIAFWLAAALVMGCLYPYLPGRNGVLKSLVLTAIYATTLAISARLLGGGSGWIFRSLELLLFLAALGVSLDWMTIVRAGLYWRHLPELYRLRDVRVLAGSASSLLLALLAIGQQVLSGDAQRAVIEIIKSFASLAPQLPG
jgi:hypothetical protein